MDLLNNRNYGNIASSAPIFGPDDDERKKSAARKEDPDSQALAEWADGYGSFSKGVSPEVYKNTMSDIAGVKSRLRGYAAEDRDREPADSRLRSTFINTIDPGVTPERMQRQYAQSDAALDYVLGGSFGQDMKNRLDANRKDSQERTNDDYVRNVSAIGSNPENAFYLSLKSDDPLKDVEKTIAGTDIQELEERVAPIVRHGGYDKQEYINERVLPEMYGRLVDELIEEEVPKNSTEYILRSSLNNSLAGKVALWGKDLLTGSSTHTQLQNEALNRYKPGFFEDVFSGVGSLLVDAPVFSALGTMSLNAMSGVSAKLTNRLTTKILASKMGEGMTRATASEIARRIITRKLGHKILVSSGTQALTLGGYDALNSVVDDFLYQNDVNVGKAAESFGKGLLTGAVLGFVGTPLRESAKGLTGARKALASTGVLSAESAVFTAGGLIEKMKYGIDIEPVDIMEDYAKSAATLIVMRMAHWRPAGASLKLGANGKLKEDFNLSSSERAELKELNVNPEQFIAAIEAELKLPSFGGERARFIKDAYCTLMTSDRLSASAKSKLMFLVENKVTSTPPVTFDFTAEQRADGKWKINTYDSFGRIVSSNLFNHAGNAKSYLMVNRGEIRRNRIVLFETELTEGLRSENFLRQAGLYAKEKNKDIDEIATAVYKKSIGEKLDFHERVIVDDILQRASYDEAGMVQMLYDVRRKIEKRYGLEEGSMLLFVNKQFYELSDAQNAALDEYERVVRDEVDRLKHGTDRERSVRLLKQGLGSEYFGMNNEEVKVREIEDYHRRASERNADRVGLYQQPRSSMAPRLLYIPPEDNSGYVWSYGEAKNTKEDIASYMKRADELADRFGIKLNYIFDEREIERPSAEDYNAVVEYNNQVVSSGWVNNGKVFINLPNAKNVQELEQTVLHEVVAHKGLMHVFGEHLYDFMEDVFKKASPEVLQGINRIKHKYRGADNYTVVEEYLAYLAENVKLEPQERTLYVRVKDYIKSLLIRLKLYTGSNRQISEAELTRIMQRHSEYMQRGTAPHDYMKDVFGDFKSAHYNGNTYYNRAEFNKDIASRIEKGKLLSSTPRLFRDSKEFMYYDFLPPEQQKRVRERHGLSEEDMQRYAGSGQFRVNRVPDGSYVPVDEKTSLSERSGVIPGNSSSKGLLQGSSGHLSRYSLATHEDVANIQRNTELTKLSAKKSVNRGGFVDLKTTEDAVRKIGESLKLTKSKSSQSYYGDFYEGDIDVDGKTLHLRISTHPANGARIGNHPANDKISIVLYKNGEHTSKDKNSDNAEHNGYVEYLYDPKDVSLNDAANSILNGVVELIERGEFVDFTGKAERMEYPYNKDGNLYYRLPDEPYNNDEKTTSGERSGVIPGNSSSGGLLQVSNGHLSHYALTSQEDVTNIRKNTDNSYFSGRKKINEGGFNDIETPEDAVRKLGESLKLRKSKSTQSFYGDLYEGDIEVDGQTLHLRVSTHPAVGNRMGNANADDKISIVVYKDGIHKTYGEHDGYKEYVYYPKDISPTDAANAIIKGVVYLIRNGEYIDYSKKAVLTEYPYNNDGNLYYRLPDEPYNNDEKTTSGERSGAVPGNSSSGGLFLEGSAHLNRYPLAQPKHTTNIQKNLRNDAFVTNLAQKPASLEDMTKILYEIADSKQDVLNNVNENGEPLPEYYPRNDIKYRLPDDAPNKEPHYRASEDLYQVHDGEERRSLEHEALERGKANDPTMEVPILEDPFFRSLRANSPTYSYAYEHLRKLPLEQWRSYDHDLWNTLVGMAEGGAVQFVLKDIVTDRNFLKDYPELAMVPVTIEKELPMPVMYDKARNRILIDRRIYLYPQSKFYIDGALKSVARDFDERRASAERQVGEFNTRFTKNYDDAVTFARKIEKMREFIPDFDADNSIAEAYRNEYGFLPDEFLRRFPTMDDYLLYRVTRSMGGLIREDATPEERRAKEGMLDKKIGKYRKFFWGPVEIIMDAAKSASGEGPLRVATKKDHENQELPSSGLDHSERAALFMKYFPGVFKYFNVPDPTIEYDRTGWEEYKRIRDAKIKAEKEKWGLDEEKLKEEERERKRLEMN